MSSKSLIIGANKVSLQGPAKITHEGGDPVLIADLDGGLPGTERTLSFEGAEVVVDGDDEFQPSDPSARSTEIGEAVVVRALGQANVTLTEIVKIPEVEEEVEELAA